MKESHFDTGTKVREEVLGSEHVEQAFTRTTKFRCRLPALHHGNGLGLRLGSTRPGIVDEGITSPLILIHNWPV